MKVHTNLKKADLLKVNVLLTLRSKGTYYLVSIVALFILSYSFYNHGLPKSVEVWGTVFLIAISSGVLAALFGLATSIIYILLASKKSNGVLGIHEYQITQDGLFEKTEVNETFTKWSGILSVKKLHSLLLIQIAPGLFHIIPAYSFKKPENYETFVKLTKRYWEQPGSV